MKRSVASLAVAVAVALGLSSPARSQTVAAPLEINFGYTTADHVNLYVAQDLGLFERVGLKPRFFTFQSGAPLLAAIKSGSVDVVTAGLGLAFALGQRIPITLILWNSNDSLGEGLVVDPASGIRSWQDIGKARKIGAASGTCAQVALYMAGRKAGIDFAKFDVVNLPAPLMRNALMSGSIDAGIAWSPYSVALDAEGYKVVGWDSEIAPPGGLCPRTTGVRPEFLKAHPEVGRKLIEVDALAAEAVAKNPQLGIDAIAKRLSLPQPVAKATFERLYLRRPSYAEQLDAASPYSMTSKDGGLAGQYLLATRILHEIRSIPDPVSAAVIHQAIDPTPLRQFVGDAKK